jgi:hypothetical protein
MNKLTFLGICPITLGIAYTSVSGGVTYIYIYSNTNCISEIIPHDKHDVENSVSDLVIETDSMIQNPPAYRGLWDIKQQKRYNPHWSNTKNLSSVPSHMPPSDWQQ